MFRITNYIVAAVLFLAWGTARAQTEWRTDLPKALTDAMNSDRLILVNFTTAACPECRLMQRTIYVTAAFASYAAGNLILVQIDTDAQSPLPPELKQANGELVLSF